MSLLGTTPPQSFTRFIGEIFGTSQGWKLIGYGTGIGFVFAVVALSVSVVSFPMLLDRDVDVLVAVQTSIKAVLMNPFTMALWELIVAARLAAGFLLVLPASRSWCPFSRAPVRIISTALLCDKFQEKPPWDWRSLVKPVPPGVEQRNFVRSRDIAFAKARMRG